MQTESASNSGLPPTSISITTRNSQGVVNRTISLDDIEIKLNRWGGRDVCIKSTKENLGLNVNDLINGFNNSIEQGKLSYSNQVKVRDKLKEFTEVKGGHIPGMEKANKGQIFLHFLRSLSGNNSREASLSKLDARIELSKLQEDVKSFSFNSNKSKFDDNLMKNCDLHLEKLKKLKSNIEVNKINIESFSLEIDKLITLSEKARLNPLKKEIEALTDNFSKKEVSNEEIMMNCNDCLEKLNKIKSKNEDNKIDINNSEIESLMKQIYNVKLQTAQLQTDKLNADVHSLSSQFTEKSLPMDFLKNCNKNLRQLNKIQSEVGAISTDDFKSKINNLINETKEIKDRYKNGDEFFKQVNSMQQNFVDASVEMKSLFNENISLQNKGVVDCTKVIEFLDSIHHSVSKIEMSSSTMQNELKAIKETLGGYDDAQTQNNKNAYKALFNISIGMDNVIHDFLSDCEMGFYEALGSETNMKSFSEGMTIKMENKLLKCEVKITSEDDLRQLNESCDRYIKLLKSIHGNLIGIYPKVPEEVKKS